MNEVRGRSWGRFLLFAGLAFVALIVLLQRNFWVEKIATLNVAVNSAAIASSPIYFFTEDHQRGARVKVDITGFPTGKLALDALLSKGVDAATAAETPVLLARDHPELRILAVLSRSGLRVVADSTRGVRTPSDLRGKRIGVPIGTSAHFFLEQYLSAAGIPIDSVDIVNAQPGDLIASLSHGNVDAIAIWEPMALRALKAIEPKGISMQADSVYKEHFLLVTTQEKLDTKRESFRRLLTGLIGAQVSMQENLAQSQMIVAARVQIPQEEVAQIWSRFEFPLNVDDTLLETLSNVEGWASRQKKYTPRSKDELSSLIAPDLLREIDPARVSLHP